MVYAFSLPRDIPTAMHHVSATPMVEEKVRARSRAANTRLGPSVCTVDGGLKYLALRLHLDDFT